LNNVRRRAIDIIPAVDIRNGKCVRLFQGDYNRETVFNENPLEVALQWQVLGAQRLHIVDLDGAAAGTTVNLRVVEKMAKVLKVPIQLGGGIRSLETIEILIGIGIKRVILGTAAVENLDMVQTACSKYAEFVIVSIDARDGQVATRGWLQGTQLKAVKLAQDMARLGVRRFIYTDINSDGTLVGPNYKAITDLVKAVNLPVIAAGGISSVGHLKVLKQIGVEGAIIGKALYTGDIDLKQALEMAR
jgi:phosphoribosylformimino-5-aminoimidazole carboxamide ribotide isomerase